jgi:hypothetical protein
MSDVSPSESRLSEGMMTNQADPLSPSFARSLVVQAVALKAEANAAFSAKDFVKANELYSKVSPRRPLSWVLWLTVVVAVGD